MRASPLCSLLCWLIGSSFLKVARDRYAREEPDEWARLMAHEPWILQHALGGPYCHCCCLASRMLTAIMRAGGARRVDGYNPCLPLPRMLARAAPRTAEASIFKFCLWFDKDYDYYYLKYLLVMSVTPPRYSTVDVVII